MNIIDNIMDLSEQIYKDTEALTSIDASKRKEAEQRLPFETMTLNALVNASKVLIVD